MPIYEPGLDKLVADNVRGRPAVLHHRPRDAVGDADAVFIAVGTPTRRGDGHADLTYVYAAAAESRRGASRGYTVVVTKSTVPVGTGREVARIIRETRPDAEFDVVSNPEFLREGSAIEDFMRPDRVVIGVESERARDVMAAVYRPLYLIETPIVFTKIETAELIKYAANAFLATKITFINEIADLCEKVGADVHDVARGIGLDGRIGRKFLHPGPGYGGSCFPKDTLALAHTAREARRAAAHRRAGDRGQQHAQEEDGAEGHRLLRRLGRRARRSPCSASPSSPTPTTCATRRRSTSCRRCRRPARRSWPSIPRAWRRRPSMLPGVTFAKHRLRGGGGRRRAWSSSPNGTSSAASTRGVSSR